MIDFYDGQIADLLPKNLTREPAAQAFSYAIREGTRLLHRYTQLCYVYCGIDTAPDTILNLLAKELRTQYYSDTLDIETKRGLVRNTLIWYMTAGTPAAVDELVTMVFGVGKVSEWFEYGDDPYYFKITTDAALTEELSDQLTKMISGVKNTRSHLRSIDIIRKAENTIFPIAILGNNAHLAMTNDIHFEEEKYLELRAMIAISGEIYEDCEGNTGRNTQVHLDSRTSWLATSLGHNTHCLLHEGGNRNKDLAGNLSVGSILGCGTFCRLGLPIS